MSIYCKSGAGAGAGTGGEIVDKGGAGAKADAKNK